MAVFSFRIGRINLNISAMGTRTIAIRTFVLVAFVTIAYLPSISAPFAFDDFPNIVFNSSVQPEGWQDLTKALDARGGQDRPVAMLSFALNYLAGGADTTGYHTVNLVVHAINAVLLFTLLRALTRATRSPANLRSNAVPFAFAGALIWALHPVNTQAVSYIVQRMTSLAALFYLLTLVLFVLWRLGELRTRWALPAMVLAFALGMGTKSHVITLPAALLLVDIAFFAGWRRYHAVAGGMLLVCAVPIALWAGVGLGSLIETPAHRDFNGVERWLTQGRVIWHYLSLLAWPDAGRLQVDYAFAVSRSLLDPPSTAIAWTSLIALTGAALYWLRYAPWLATGWLFFLVALSVESSFILLELAFEHRVYLPATLLIPGMIAPIFTRIESVQGVNFIGVSVLLIAAVCASQTIERNRAWRDPGGLWASDLERGASPQRAALNSAVGHMQSGQFAAAANVLASTGMDERGGNAAKIHQVSGEALFAQGRCDEALTKFKKVLELVPRSTRTAHFTARCLYNLGRVSGAVDLLDQMKRHNPESLFTVTLAADFAGRDGEFRHGLTMLNDYIAEADALPAVSRSFVHMQRGNLFRRAGRYGEAASAYGTAVDLYPNNWAAWASLYHVVRERGDLERAKSVRDYMHSRGINPNRWR